MTEETSENLDLIVGARAISAFLFGTEEKAKAIYPLRKHLGLFNLGGKIAGRRGTLRERIAAKEAAAAAKAENVTA